MRQVNMLAFHPDTWNEGKHKEWDSWVDSRPEKIKALVIKYPPWFCYKSKENGGHYAIASYRESDSPTLTLNHASDSFGPGIQVFDIDPSTLYVCGCGKAYAPTEEQIEHTFDKIKTMKKMRTTMITGIDND